MITRQTNGESRCDHFIVIILLYHIVFTTQKYRLCCRNVVAETSRTFQAERAEIRACITAVCYLYARKSLRPHTGCELSVSTTRRVETKSAGSHDVFLSCAAAVSASRFGRLRDFGREKSASDGNEAGGREPRDGEPKTSRTALWISAGTALYAR